MKTLENQTLLYDEDCPLCRAYTSGFIKTGMLDKNGRKSYAGISEQESQTIDIKRATNEIALFDTKNKTVVYGIDSLLKIIGHSFPLIEKTGNLSLINYILKRVYSFISYNRKVIIPGAQNKNNPLKCVPDFNFKYRILYISFATAITIIVLFHCSKMIPGIPASDYKRGFFLATGQILFQSFFLSNYDKKTILAYIGNLMTVSLFGSLLLLPIIAIHQVISINPVVVILWFGTTVLFMLKEHFRRIALLDLPKYLTLTWILYRIIALFLILNY